jgi:hypothetical protein
MFNLRSPGFGAENSSERTAVLPAPRFRPQLETIEDRCVPAQLLPVADLVTITDVDLTGIAIDFATGVLTATGGTVEGTLAGLPFETDISNFSIDLLPDLPGTTPILDLELGPIDIDLLGAFIDTSPICLTITATPGGGLLGDLLSGLNLGNLTNIDDALEGILDGVLTGVLNNGGGGGGSSGGAEDICDGENEVLDLALGPVNLNLLGLNVSLDDCEGGPVQVCISATEGEGILGDLLSGLAGGGGLDIGDLTQIFGLADSLDDDGISRRDEAQLSNLVRKLNR